MNPKPFALISIIFISISTLWGMVGYASLLSILPPQTLFAMSDLVVTGVVLDIDAQWGLGTESAIITVVTIELEGIAKGEVNSRIIEVTYPGGNMGVFGLWVEDQPTFVKGEHLLLYLKSNSITPPGAPRYSLTTGTLMGKSDTTGITTVGLDGKLVLTKPLTTNNTVLLMEEGLIPLIIITLFGFILIIWLKKR